MPRSPPAYQTLILLATALSGFVLFIPPYYLPTFATSVGYDASVGAYLVAGFNIANALGRLVSSPAP